MEKEGPKTETGKEWKICVDVVQVNKPNETALNVQPSELRSKSELLHKLSYKTYGQILDT